MRFVGGLSPYAESGISHEDSDHVHFVGGLYSYAESGVSHDSKTIGRSLYPIIRGL